MKIMVINTGGTISCVGNPLAPMTAQQFADASRRLLDPILLQAYPQLQIHYATDLSFPESASHTLDSTNLQPSDWCLIADTILQHYAHFDGWVVLHGTDSMDFSGTALPFLLSSFSADGIATGALSKPVVVTGSQVPMFHEARAGAPLSINFNTDALQNFCGAVAFAQSGIAEVCVCFHDKLYRGNRVMKTNATQFDAFSSPNCPALGQIGVEVGMVAMNTLPPPVSFEVSLDNPQVLVAVREQLKAIRAVIDQCAVMQFNAFPAAYRFDDKQGTSSALIARLIDAAVAQGIQGLVLESYGEGNFPSGNPDHPEGGAICQALARAAKSVVIVDNTQVISGTVNNGAYAAGAWLPQAGVLNGADLTPMASFAKLMVLLAAAGHQGWSREVVKTLQQSNLLGEMISVNRLDSRGHDRLLPWQSIAALDGSAQLLNDPAAGPLLKDMKAGGKILWSALPQPAAGDLPGPLRMQDDGNLVFYSRNNQPLWATGTGSAWGASSLLTLDGSTRTGDLVLRVIDYSVPKVSATIYPG